MPSTPWLVLQELEAALDLFTGTASLSSRAEKNEVIVDLLNHIQLVPQVGSLALGTGCQELTPAN
jgi:hypothetical protein